VAAAVVVSAEAAAAAVLTVAAAVADTTATINEEYYYPFHKSLLTEKGFFLLIKKAADCGFLKKINKTYSPEVLTCPVFASILKVACGTALKRALSINLPVTRQTP
jgi:hypothetical protein